MAKRDLPQYVQIMEDEITADLARIVDADKLQEEVRKALAKEICTQASSALSEFIQSLSFYAHNEEMVRKAESKTARFAGYVTTLLAVRDSQRLIAAPVEVEVDG